MSERQRADEQPGNNLVTDTKADNGIEHIMRERYRRRHRDDVAAEQGQIHTVLTLRDTITHCRHATGKLRNCPGICGGRAYDVRIGFVGLVGAQHVVIG